ncbi:MAG TPA: hypothetical protein VFS58_14315, partial [Steroidobacteraceae bacterium]|nr:hypothetical protein [Steroidobacteraceae bacterium]
ASVWLAAAITAALATERSAIFALFVGGMFIHPIAMLLSKLAGRPGSHDKANPLGRLAIESTVWLLLAIPIAFLASLQGPEWFFLAMLLTIGGRYFTFATLYGLRIYWACGAVLAACAFALAALGASSFVAALTGSIVEFVFAGAVFYSQRQKMGSDPTIRGR